MPIDRHTLPDLKNYIWKSGQISKRFPYLDSQLILSFTFLIHYIWILLSEKCKAFDFLDKMRYVLWVVELVEACDVTKLGCRLGRHLGFQWPRIRNQVKTERISFFFLTCKIIQINKYFASFYLQALILSIVKTSWKTCENTQKELQSSLPTEL